MRNGKICNKNIEFGKFSIKKCSFGKFYFLDDIIIIIYGKLHKHINN